MLEALAQKCDLQAQVHFLGQLTAGAAVREQMDCADLFLLPSLTEGLPRALIEAMARGVPCVGSSVGGIPELLEPEDMVPPGSVEQLADKIQTIVTDPARMARMSRQNLKRADTFRKELLESRQSAFYAYVRASTEAWLGAHP
jgi:glycosyltransferase involved in cell wall biosynthesis